MLFLSRLHPKKNLPELLRAWRLVRQEVELAKQWVLVIAGWDQGGHEAELKRLAADLELGCSVEFIGPQFGAQKASCFFHAEAFCLPSLSEGLPVAVLEAWAYGLPVLMTPECNLPEGFAARAAIALGRDAVGIARGVRKLMETSQAERDALGERGRKLTAHRFAWPLIAEEIASVYRWVLGEGPTPSSVRRV